ncbi:hypothetical protein Efla_003375 [Eimeria flavescens]
MSACLLRWRLQCWPSSGGPVSSLWGAPRLPAAAAAAATLQQQKQQQQRQQQQRNFSRFRRAGFPRTFPPAETLNPKPSPEGSDGKHSPSPSRANPKPLNREAAIRQSKVSSEEDLFAECVASLRHKRWELGDPLEAPSPEIEELSRQEKEVVGKLMRRTQQDTQGSSASPGIDAFWDPMVRVEALEAQVAHDFEEFTKLVGAAEARRQRLLLRESLKKAAKVHDPLSAARAEYFGAEGGDSPPSPHRQAERFWDPDDALRAALKNKNLPITWKDLHVLHHFIGSNGLLLPRRLTHASRIQQRYIYKAISTARRMGLLPYDRKPPAACMLPLMDPLQYLVDELTHRVSTGGDLRAEAMLRVLMQRYPRLDYFRFLQLQARWKEEGRGSQAKHQQPSAFQRLFRP